VPLCGYEGLVSGPIERPVGGTSRVLHSCDFTVVTGLSQNLNGNFGMDIKVRFKSGFPRFFSYRDVMPCEMFQQF